MGTKKSFSTRCVHEGEIKDTMYQGIVSPLFMSTTYPWYGGDAEKKPYPRYFNTPNQEFLSKKIKADVYIKVEGCNPSGSFKDRGMVVAVCMALHNKKKVLVCASTGNTSASASAYAAKYGLVSAIIVPNGNIAKGKLSQAMAFGAKIIAIDGSFDDALNIVRKLENYDEIEIVNSINPYRIEGQKSAAFEILDEIGEIDSLCIPVGNAGNITAYWKGFNEYSKKLNYKFIDSDALIEEKTGVKVPLIFEYEGESGFRKRETKILSEIIKMNSIVLATGGGIILSKTNRQLISESSVVIYLNATIKELVKRLANDKDRPLIQNVDKETKLRELIERRGSLYESIADYIIQTKEKRASEIASEIILNLRANENN